MEQLVKRCQKLAFYGVPTENGVSYHRMSGFTEFSKTENPKEYKRQYIDEEHERNDIVGYSPSISYAFDRFSGNPVHQDLVNITDSELTGTEAVRSIVLVDLTQEADGKFSAVKRDFAIIPDSEGAGAEAYIYNGNLKTSGDKVSGYASTEDDWQTLTFTE